MPIEQHLINNVSAFYPKIDRTYRFDQAENRSVPCDSLDDGAEYTLQFNMSKETARDLYNYMKSAYAESKKSNWPELKNSFKKNDDGSFRYKASLKGAYNGEITIKPAQYDAKTQKLPDDFQLTSDSVINIAVVGVPYSGSMGSGVSLRLKAVQVIKLAERKDTSPFKTMDGYDASESNPFVATVEEPDDFDSVEETPVEEPKKVTKKTKPAPETNDVDLSKIVDAWDD